MHPSPGRLPSPALDLTDANDLHVHVAAEVVPVAQHTDCANCSQALVGDFCHHCGQSAHLHRSILHLGEEVLHGLYHFDAKAWRTIPLLVLHPGQLTRRYIDGQRTRFVSPLALFLFMIFAMFFVFSLVGDGDAALTRVQQAAQTPEVKASFAKDVVDSRAALAAAQSKLDALRAAPTSSKAAIAEAEAAVNEARLSERVASTMLKPFDLAAAPPTDKTRWRDQLTIDTGNHAIDRSLRHALENPELAWYKLKNTAYKFAILLVPISLPFLWLLFARRREFGMYDHAVFALYSLSFMSLLVMLATLLGAGGLPNLASTLLVLTPPVHMFVQLRGAYQLGTRAALWRAILLSITAATVFVLFLLLIVVLTVR